MGKQSIKQQARRAALGVQAKRRAQRAAREKRLEDLAVQVLTAVGERDAAIAEAERRAGVALAAMTEAEGLTLREAAEWCGEQISVHEATRLRRLAYDAERGSRSTPGSGAAGSSVRGDGSNNTAVGPSPS